MNFLLFILFLIMRYQPGTLEMIDTDQNIVTIGDASGDRSYSVANNTNLGKFGNLLGCHVGAFLFDERIVGVFKLGAASGEVAGVNDASVNSTVVPTGCPDQETGGINQQAGNTGQQIPGGQIEPGSSGSNK
jgi:hypothetical protein